ncbi:MAG: glutathione synthase [bacterium]
MRIAFVMDPIASVNIHADTTFALMLAAQERGHEVYYVRMQDLEARGDEAWSLVQHCEVRREEGNHFTLSEVEHEPLHTFDCIFMRKDPPFDIAYLHAVHLLELAEEKGTLVMNKPTGLRGANEKLYALHFPSCMPKTIVTKRSQEIRDFAREHGGQCIIKPLDGHGGSGVLLFSLTDRNANALLEMSTRDETEYLMVQQYIPAAREGDKRILMLDGQPLGAILRVPKEEDNRGNIHVGGRVEKTYLSERDQEICAAVGPRLSRDGLWFVGLDVIGGYLTEVNVTSPTGIQEMSRLDGTDGAGDVIAWIENRI